MLGLRNEVAHKRLNPFTLKLFGGPSPRAGTLPRKPQPTIQQTNVPTCSAKRPSNLQSFNPSTEKKRAQESKGIHPSTLELLNTFAKKLSSSLAL
jgi:hypothetical protein